MHYHRVSTLFCTLVTSRQAQSYILLSVLAVELASDSVSELRCFNCLRARADASERLPLDLVLELPAFAIIAATEMGFMTPGGAGGESGGVVVTSSGLFSLSVVGVGCSTSVVVGVSSVVETVVGFVLSGLCRITGLQYLLY